MTQRERHTPDGGAPNLPQSGPPRPASAPASPALWEDWYRRASPEQQRDLVALALRQGLLYAPQLPPPAGNGTLAAGEAGPRALLTALLNGQARIEPVRAAEVTVEDTDLDAMQRQAVARALATPDLCLIQGVPGTGKSRVIAEVVRQATQRGQRVLLLAPAPPALDRVLERLGCRDTLYPVRCLAPEESLDALPPCVRWLTIAERVRCFREHTLPAARKAIAEVRAEHARREAQQDTWARLEAAAVRYEEQAARLREMEQQRDGIAAAVAAELDGAAGEADPAAHQAEWLACRRRRDEVRKDLDARLVAVQEEIKKQEANLRQAEAAVAECRPLAEAVRDRRWWTGAWWRGVFRGKVLARLEEGERCRDDRRAALDKLVQEMAGIEAEQAEADRNLASARQRLIETEAGRRRAACDAEMAALAAEQSRTRAEFDRAAAALGDGTGKPAELSAAAVRDGREAWGRQLERDAEHEAFARQWAAAVEDAAANLPARLASCANLVAATTAGFAAEDLFANPAAPAFDLLVLDEAHQITESEFTAAARRARRWVLVGEPPATDEPCTHTPGRPTALRPGFFQRLWRPLHAAPCRLPYAWSRRGERLVCSLRPVAPEQERWLENEAVADRPDVELRILVPPRPARRGNAPAEAPHLAEVTFPATTAIEEAKAFIFRELQELPVQSPGHGLRWVEQTNRMILELTGAPRAGAVAVVLEAGVREWVQPDTGTTSVLEFDRGAGWTRDRAEGWVEEHLGLRDLGRTTRLDTPYRAMPALARFLSDVLFAGACEPAAPAEEGPGRWSAVEFVPVPSLAAGDLVGHVANLPTGESSAGYNPAPRGAAVALRAPRLRGVKGGAGLEVDLADARPLEPLPSEVRAALPRRGLVNYLEARAVVRHLECLLADAEFQAAGLHWQQRRAVLCEQAGQVCDPQANRRAAASVHRPTVAVMAVSAAQVELLRFLVSQAPGLTDGSLTVEVGLPAAFRQRECLAALVSLTRSHTHRAASYGDGPHSLVEALTRPAVRLILFGDPATLARRSQWQGPLDHLDEAAARAERGVVARLVAYLQGRGTHPHVFRLLEGSPP